MALVTCKDCGTEHSDKAATCPKCGRQVKEKRGCMAVAALIALAVIVIGIFASTASDMAEKTRRAKMTPAQFAAEAVQRAAREEHRQLIAKAAEGAKTIREQMRDPESFTLAWVKESNIAAAICYAYRARNGFGGMDGELGLYVLGTKTVYTQETRGARWIKNCGKSVGESGNDITAETIAALADR